MKTISEYLGKTLHLIQPSYWKSNYELRFEDKVIATSRKTGVFGSRTIVDGDFGNWEIFRPSIWKSIIEIKEKGNELPIASYQRKCFSNKGTVNFPMGSQLFVVFYSFKKYYEIQNQYGERLVFFKPKFNWGGEKIEIIIEKKNELLDKYGWVIMLVVYLALQRQQAHAAAAH